MQSCYKVKLVNHSDAAIYNKTLLRSILQTYDLIWLSSSTLHQEGLPIALPAYDRQRVGLTEKEN